MYKNAKKNTKIFAYIKLLYYLCTVNHVKSNIWKHKTRFYCFVNQWFSTDHNHDYMRKIVKSNIFKYTKIMPKEVTLLSFSDKKNHLHLINLYDKGVYVVSKDRRIIKRSPDYNLCRRVFINKLYEIIMSDDLKFAI